MSPDRFPIHGIDRFDYCHLIHGTSEPFHDSSEQLGFNKDQVAIVNLTPEIYAKHKPQYIQKLKDYPGIEDVAFSVYELSKEDDMIDLEYARMKIRMYSSRYSMPPRISFPSWISK